MLLFFPPLPGVEKEHPCAQTPFLLTARKSRQDSLAVRKEEQPEAPKIPPNPPDFSFQIFSVYFLPQAGAGRGRQERPGSLRSKEPVGILPEG